MRLRRWIAALLAAFGLGCAPAFHDITVMGVPNLTQVAPRLWRMGQPANEDAWAYLERQLGPNVTVVKLNDDKEGVDLVPSTWRLLKAPIPPEDDKPWTVVDRPDPKTVHAIVRAIIDAFTRGETVVWHCTAGRDRTSLISALVGMRLLGWSKAAAWKDMLAHGFRWELPDLDAYWLEDVP